MTDYTKLADRLESYRPQELGRAEDFGTDLVQAAAILRQLASVDAEVVMKCAMGWVSAPFSHQRQGNLDAAIRALAVRGAPAWRPIAEAPRDGTRIFLHPAIERADSGSKGYWSRENETWIVGGLPSGVAHTHFQPLPTPPKDQS